MSNLKFEFTRAHIGTKYGQSIQCREEKLFLKTNAMIVYEEKQADTVNDRILIGQRHSCWM